MAELDDFKSSVALVVSSCDAFFDAWRPFAAFLQKFWGDCPFEIFLLTNEVNVRSNRIRPLRLGQDRGWASNLITALEQIEHPYLLYLQEDYFLTAPVDQAQLAQDFSSVMESGADSLCFRARSEPDAGFQPLNDRFGLVPLESDGRTRCQVTLWKKSALQSLLRPGETAWDFEARGSARTQEMKILSYQRRENTPISYLMSAISRGFWMPEAIALCRRYGVAIDPFFRPVYSIYSWQRGLRRAIGRARLRRALHDQVRGTDRPVAMRLVRWNLSSRAAQLSGGDALVVSIPKSGRTWVRTFLCAYFCEKLGQPFTLEPERYDGVPRLIYTHDLFEQRTKADRWDRIRGKYLIPARERKRIPVILLARDPRDALVSLHVQLTRRTRETPAELKAMSISELLRDPVYGIESMIEIMNAWLAEWAGRSDFLLLRYEALRAEPGPGFRDFLRLLGQTPIDENAFARALEFSDFGHMQRLESRGDFESKILRAGDAQDPESFKVRRGKVGGFADYLSPNDQLLAARSLARLNPSFGYAPAARV